MADLKVRTWRASRNVIERLMGIKTVYITEISDGYRSVRARGPTEWTSMQKAKRDWDKSMQYQ
jgi:hypothetical protein